MENIIFYQVDPDLYDLYEYEITGEVSECLQVLGTILGRKLIRCDNTLFQFHQQNPFVIGSGTLESESSSKFKFRRTNPFVIVDSKSIDEEAYINFKTLRIYVYRKRSSKL